MTRTERSANPHALVKDRSVARNGRDKSLQKGGVHGWGSIKDEADLERAAEYDEAREEEEEAVAEEEGEAPRRARRASTLGDAKGVCVSTLRIILPNNRFSHLPPSSCSYRR